MDKRGIIIISITILLGFVLMGLLLKAPKEDYRYQMVSPNENNIIIFDTETGEYWRKFISPNSGPTEWEKEISPNFDN